MASSSIVIDVDSDLRYSGNSGEFTYKLQVDARQYEKISLLSCSIPKSMYLITDTFGGNTFTLTEGTSSVTVPLTPGNYTLRSLIVLLQTQLNLMSPHHYTYSVTGSSSTGKLTFVVSGNGGIQPSLTFPSSSSLFSVLGFQDESTNAFNGNTLTSKNVISLTTTTVFLKSDLVESSWVNPSVTGNILGSFSLANTPDFGVYSWSCPDPLLYARDLNQSSGGNWWFWLTDQYDSSLDLNGLPLLLSFVLWKQNNTNETNELIQRDIQISWAEKNLQNLAVE